MIKQQRLRVVELPEYPGYLIYEDGTIRGPRGRLLHPATSPTGYLYFRCRDGQRYRTPRVHQLVCMAFHGPRPSPNHQVRHLNGIRTDNRAENLAWGTAKQNQNDRVLHGTSPRGEGNGQAKITRVVAEEIRAKRTAGVRLVDLRAEYGLSLTQLSRIGRGESWRDY